MKKRCDHCGDIIDEKNDIECCEVKMFEFKYLSDKNSDYTQVDKGKIYYCGECKDKLLVRWVKNYVNKSFKKWKKEHSDKIKRTSE